MASNEHDIRIEIGFEGSQIMSALVTARAADELENALEVGKDGTLVLDAEDGRYTVALGRVVYLKRFAREGRLGFVT
jgi:molybdopterin-binding protein